MLSPRLTDCAECANIQSLILEIDCKVVEISNLLYNNLVFILNHNVPTDALSDLLNYKRILMYKISNLNYAGSYTVNQIASKIKILKYK